MENKQLMLYGETITVYRGADKSLARPGRKKLQLQKILIFLYPTYNHNWRNIITIYLYNKTSIKSNILTIKRIHREVDRAKDLSALLYCDTHMKRKRYG